MARRHDNVGCKTGRGDSDGIGDGAGRKTGEALVYYQYKEGDLHRAIENQSGTGVWVGSNMSNGKPYNIILESDDSQGYGRGAGHKQGNCDKSGHNIEQIEKYLEDIREVFKSVGESAAVIKASLGD